MTSGHTNGATKDQRPAWAGPAVDVVDPSSRKSVAGTVGPDPGSPPHLVWSGGLLEEPNVAAALAEARGDPDTGDRRPWPQPASEVEPGAALVDEYLVDGVIRPGRLLVLAAAEGVGKSRVRMELAMRLATGHGALFDHYQIPARCRVLTIDVENGDEEEIRREEETRERLGLARADLGDYWRVSLDGLTLTDARDQAYVLAAIGMARPSVVVFDTASSMVGDEWGAELKDAIRFIRLVSRTYRCAVVVVVHLTKPAKAAARGRGHADPSPHGTTLSSVMGTWTRPADSVALMADAGAERITFTMRKRVPFSQLVLKAEAGTFTAIQVVAGEDLGVSTLERIHGCIATGYADAVAIATYLEISERTVWRQVAKLRQAGRVEPDGPLRLSVPPSVPLSGDVSRPVRRPASANDAPQSPHVSAVSVPAADTLTPPLIGASVSVSVDELSEPEDGDEVDIGPLVRDLFPGTPA